jgi:DNA topoisomerase-1
MNGRWILRRGTARSGFWYADESGRRIADRRQLDRIASLVIPPAWRDVHIARSVASSVQAWGIDARGRKQYRYHQRAVVKRELRKYHRVRELARTMPRIRQTLARDARAPRLHRDAVSAIALRLIGETFCRVGGERYLRENGTYGLTTVRKTHVRVGRDWVCLSYTGKSKVPQRQFTTSPDLVKLIRGLARTPGRRLFRYRSEDGWRDLNATDVNDYLRRRVGAFNAKDFRTWGGTLRAATVLAEIGPAQSATEAKRNVALAMRLVSSELGNTPTVCRNSYVHPMVIARYLDEGETIALPRRGSLVRSGAGHQVEERALIAFLEKHFPDRRSGAKSASRKLRVPERRAAA